MEYELIDSVKKCRDHLHGIEIELSQHNRNTNELIKVIDRLVKAVYASGER